MQKHTTQSHFSEINFLRTWQKHYKMLLIMGIIILLSAPTLTAQTAYRYLRLTALDGVNPQREVYVTEINWLVGNDIYPETRTTSSSTNVNATLGSSPWRAYDGVLALPAWNSQTTTFPYSITLDLGAGQAINPTGIQIAAEWQERTMAAFLCEGSNDGTNWTSLFSESGLTSADWTRNAFKTFQFPVIPGEDPDNLITNGEFNNGTNGWNSIFQADAAGGGNFEIDSNAGMSGSNAAKINISNGGSANWNVELFSLFNLESGKNYELSFQAKAAANRPALVIFQKESDPFTHYWEQNIQLSTTTQTFGPFTWTADVSDEATRLNFKVGGNDADIWIDAVVIKEVGTAVDQEPPSQPAGLSASNLTANSFTLSWNAATDNVGVVSYEVFAGTDSQGTTSSTSMNISGLDCGTSYPITVVARDAANNLSLASSALNVSTAACSGTTYPNENAMLGMNLSHPRAWSTEFYFTNLAHHSFAWMPVGPGVNYGVRIPESELTPDLYLKPGNSGRLAIFWDLNPSSIATGNYVFTYDGTADVSLASESSSGISVVSSTSGRIEIHIPEISSNIFVFFDITNNSTSNPVNNIRFTELERENATEIFRPEFISEYQTLKVYRFMDWMDTNNSEVSAWNDYPADNALIQTGGVSFNFMIALANQTKSDAWFCVPMLADDNFVKQMADKIRDNLDPDVTAYIELSNEVWNGQFDADDQAAQKAIEAGISTNDNKPWEDAALYVGYRTAQIEQIFEDAFSETSTKPDLTVLIAWQAANVWLLENRVLPQYQATMGGNAVPDAVAIAPYFGGGLGSANVESIMENWTVDMVFDQLLNNTYGDQVGNASLSRSIGYMTAYKDFADEYEIPELLAYEGGQHLVGVASANNNTAIRSLFEAANRDRRMYDVYTLYFDAWKQIGGGLFATFASTDSYKKSGSWGWKEYPSQTRQEAPKYDAILSWNANNQTLTENAVGASLEKTASAEERVVLYPNPVQENGVTIEFENSKGNTLTIHDRDGKVYVDEVVNQKVKKIAVDRLKPGFYIFKINGVSQRVLIH